MADCLPAPRTGVPVPWGTEERGRDGVLPRRARETCEVALGGKKRVCSGGAAPRVAAPSPRVPSLLAQKGTLVLCPFQKNCTAKSHFSALETRDAQCSWP